MDHAKKPKTISGMKRSLVDYLSVANTRLRFGDKQFLIIPEWPSAYFWPFLRERCSQFKPFVVDVFLLPAINDLSLEGPCQKQIYKSRRSVFRVCPRFRMLALRLGFT